MLEGDISHLHNGYVIDAESAAETARLIKQDRLLAPYLGGVFAEGVDLTQATSVLDLACGPGSWVLEVAFASPHLQVVGVDLSLTTIEYARARALTQSIDNASFQVMDITGPLAFPDAHFDIVNARLLVGVLTTEAWRPLLRECVRVARPGGLIRLTECEATISTSSALQELTALGTLALKLAGHSFSPDGHTLGVTAVLAHLLREVGCRQVTSKPCAIDYSVGTDLHPHMVDHALVTWLQLEPFLLKMGVISAEAFKQLYQRMYIEMLADDFCALWYYLTAWGRLPGPHQPAQEGDQSPAASAPDEAPPGGQPPGHRQREPG